MAGTKHRGATMLELAMVVVILTILSGAGIVAWRSVQDHAYESTAESSMQSAAATQLSYMRSRGQWGTQQSALTSIQGGVAMTTGQSTGSDTVSLAVDDAGRLVLAALADNGSCLALRITASGEVGSIVNVQLPLNCSASSAATTGLLP